LEDGYHERKRRKKKVRWKIDMRKNADPKTQIIKRVINSYL
jgi:hypothetical protein